MIQYMLTVIIPVCNSEAYLPICINSVQAQSFNNYEIIIVESCSTDKTVEMCKDLAKNHNNISFYTIIESGVSAARNFAIEKAKGKYIYFLDADDYIEANAFEHLLYYAEKFECDIVCGNFNLIRDIPLINQVAKVKNEFSESMKPYVDNPLSEKEIISYLYQVEFFFAVCWNKLYLLSFINEHSIRFPTWTDDCEDLNFNIDALAKCKKFYISSRACYNYLQRTDSGIADLLTFSEKARRCVKGYEWALKKLMNLNHANCTDELKKKAFLKIAEIVSNFFCDVQVRYIESYIYSNLIDYDKPYIVFGSGHYCAKILKREERFHKLVIADNNILKVDTYLYGYKIISPQSINQYDSSDCKIIIATKYFFEILVQLLNMNIVTDIKKLFIDNAESKWFSIFYDFYSEILTQFYLSEEYQFLRGEQNAKRIIDNISKSPREQV